MLSANLIKAVLLFDRCGNAAPYTVNNVAAFGWISVAHFVYRLGKDRTGLAKKECLSTCKKGLFGRRLENPDWRRLNDVVEGNIAYSSEYYSQISYPELQPFVLPM